MGWILFSSKVVNKWQNLYILWYQKACVFILISNKKINYHFYNFQHLEKVRNTEILNIVNFIELIDKLQNWHKTWFYWGKVKTLCYYIKNKSFSNHKFNTMGKLHFYLFMKFSITILIFLLFFEVSFFVYTYFSFLF